MVLILSICAVTVAAMLAYFLLGAALESEAAKMEAQASTEARIGDGFRRRGLHHEAEWHAENARLLARNARFCAKVAKWLR